MCVANEGAMIRFDKLTIKAQEALQAALDALSTQVLSGQFAEGDKVRVDADKKGDTLTFSKS